MTNTDPPTPVFPLLLGMEWLTDTPGGLNRYFADLVQALHDDAESEVTAVALGPADHAPSHVFRASDHRAPIAGRLLGFGRKAEQLAAAADVVDGHFALYTAAALTFRRVRRPPLVVHFHGPWAAESRLQAVNPITEAMKRRLERFVYRRADAVVVLSLAFKELVETEYGVLPQKVHVIPPAVNLSRFEPGERSAARKRLGLPVDAFVIGSARRLVPRMGIDILIDAFSRLADDKSVLAVAGEGPEKAELERSVRRHGLDGRIHFLGRVSDEDLVELYRSADVVVVPSTALEGFGLVVLEALACGTPVIASDVGGLPDALGGLDPSLLVPPGDAAALNDRIAAFRDSDKRPSPTECRAHASSFSMGSLARSHRELYRKVAHAQGTTRVVYLTHTSKPSGAELALVRMVSALGSDVDALVILGEDGPLCETLAAAGIAYEVLPMGSASTMRRDDVARVGVSQARAAASTMRYTARLARRLRQLQPDLVHTNSLKAAVYGGAAARLARVPVIWHMHDRISSDYLPSPAVGFIRGLARAVPHGVIANSHATLETLPASRGPRRVIGNAAPVDFDPVVPPDPDRVFTVGVIGRLAEWKGQSVVLKAFAEAFPTGDSRCHIVGAALFGEDEYEQELRDLARELGINDRVDFRGHRSDVGREYAALDVVVHSSVLPEPFGQVIVEAQAAGRPIIASAAGGVLELVEDGETGLLYPPGDVAALASRLQQLANEPEMRARLSANGLDALARFAPAAISEEVMSMYVDVLGGPVES